MSKDSTNSIQNDTYYNQDDLNCSEILDVGGIKHGGKTVELKYDDNCLLDNKGDNFQDKLLKNVLDNEKKNGKQNAKILSLKNELKEKVKAIKEWNTLLKIIITSLLGGIGKCGASWWGGR